MEGKTGGERLVAVMLELWLHVFMRIFFGLTCVYVYCVVFEIFDVSELWLQVEGVQVRCLGERAERAWKVNRQLHY